MDVANSAQFYGSVFKTQGVWETIGCKKEDVTGQWKEVHTELDGIKLEWWMQGGICHPWEIWEMHKKILSWKLKGRDHYGSQVLD